MTGNLADQPDRRRVHHDRPADHGSAVRGRARSARGDLDLIPLAGATVAGIIVVAVAFLHSVPAGIVLLIFVIAYQQLENHFLQPVIYGRTVQLSPLVVLISVLVGAELAGILGALAAIPVAGSIQVVVRDLLAHRRPASSTRRPAALNPPFGHGSPSDRLADAEFVASERTGVFWARSRGSVRRSSPWQRLPPCPRAAPPWRVLESGLLQQLNAVRADHGLAALRARTRSWLPLPTSIPARWRTNGYFDHNSVDGTTFASRIAKWYPLRSLQPGSVGENLLWSSPVSTRRSGSMMWMRFPPTAPTSSCPVPRDRHRRRLQHLGSRHLHPPAGHDHHDRLRRSPLSGVPFSLGGRP